MIRYRILFLIVISFLGGFLIAFILFYKSPDTRVTGTEQLRLGQGTFINPLIACELDNQTAFEELSLLKKKLDAHIQKLLKENQAEKISVYVRNLNNGHWVGINENEQYVPASLIKVPLMIAYFKLAEFNAKILDQKFLFEGGINENTRQVLAPPPNSLEAGKIYTVLHLITRMITYSGNNSYNILLHNINKKVLEQIYTDLGINFTGDTIATSLISPKSYATFFRILYNASYLNKNYSEKALELLSQTTFKDGIATNIPNGIAVAHKFGERTVTEK